MSEAIFTFPSPAAKPLVLQIAPWNDLGCLGKHKFDFYQLNRLCGQLRFDHPANKKMLLLGQWGNSRPFGQQQFFRVQGIHEGDIRRILWTMRSLFLLTLAACSIAFGGTGHPVKNAAIKSASVLYACDDAKYIEVTWLSEAVDLKLSDKRKFILRRTNSAGGERYANKTEAVIFWLKGNTTFIWEKGVETFGKCVEVPG